MNQSMTILQGLKWFAPKRATPPTPIEFRRAKLRKRLKQQIELAQAQLDGHPLHTIRRRLVTDRISGEQRETEHRIRVRCWWFTSEHGKIGLEIKYGSKALEFQKGKTALELDSVAALIPMLERMIVALDAGELDLLIQAASDQLKTRFRAKPH
jgi:hypothetical protein